MPVLGAARSSTGLKNSTTPEAYGATGNDSQHDDAPGIEAAIAAVVAACIADGSYVCEVVFDAAKNYYANRAPVANSVINGVNSYANAQISLPYLAWGWQAPNATPLVTLTLRSQAPKQSSNTTFSQQPCSIITTPTTGAGLASFGIPSVIGGPASGNSSSPPTQWSGIHLIINGLNIISPPNPVFCGLDLNRVNTCDIESMHIFVPTNGYSPPTAATNKFAIGVKFPGNQNGGNIRVGHLGVYGYYCGFSMPEHLVAENIQLYWNQLAVSFDQIGDHESHIRLLQTTGNTCLIGRLTASGAEDLPAVSFPPLIIDQWGMEDITATIKDANNVLNLTASIFNVSVATQRLPTITGGAHVLITNLKQARGAITAPTVPATTVAYQNAYGRDAWVVVTGGTVTAIAVDGVATGLTSGQILVPNGKTITLTYSAVPIWNWVLF